MPICLINIMIKRSLIMENKEDYELKMQETTEKKRRILKEIDDLIQYQLETATRMYNYPDNNDVEMPNKSRMSMIKRSITVLGEQRDLITKKIINYMLKNNTALYYEYRYAVLAKIQDIEELFNVYFRDKTDELVLAARAAGKDEMAAIHNKEKGEN